MLVRYRFLVKAMIGEGIYQVGIFYSSPPNIGGASGPLTRMIGGAVCPGATSWAVDVSAVDVGEGVTPETSMSAQQNLQSRSACSHGRYPFIDSSDTNWCCKTTARRKHHLPQSPE